MPINFGSPSLTQLRADYAQSVRDAVAALSQWLDPAVAGTLTGTPTGAYRLSAGAVQRWSGSAWGAQAINGVNLSGTSVVVGSATAFTTRSAGTGVVPNLQALGTSTATASTLAARFAADTSGPVMFLAKSRGATVGSQAAVVSGDTLGEVKWGGSDGTNIVDAGGVRAVVDGTPGASVMPSRLEWSTNAGSASPTVRMRLGSTGHLTPAATGTQELGGSTLRWSTVFGVAANFSGVVTALSVSATTATFTAPITAPGTFAINGSGPGAQPSGLYVADLGGTVGTTNNPTFTAAIAGQVDASRSVALSVDSSGYLYGFRSHTGTGPWTWQSKVRAADTLTTARTINGVAFDGSANITVADATKYPTSGGAIGGRAWTTPTALTYAATLAVNAATSNAFVVGTLTGNVTTLSISGGQEGQMLSLRFRQDATGGRTVAVPAGAKVLGTIGSAAGQTSYLSLTYNATDSRWEGNWFQVPV